MRNSQNPETHNHSKFQKSRKSKQNHLPHDGFGSSNICYLSFIPAEVLTGITSHLNPPDLFTLSQTSNAIYQHVKDDNTWRSAFLCQLVGIRPESDAQSDENVLLVRRLESSWRAEFIQHYHLKSRWKRSPNVTTTHSPLPSTISTLHLMPQHSLLAASLRYGIVSRSLPTTGKIMRSRFDASGTGLSNGNPNAEFTPNVTTCEISSDGGTARILWGYGNGEISVVTAYRAMDDVIRGAELVRCPVADMHEDSILDAIWDSDSKILMAVTSAGDGRVKLWDGKTVRCLWTSEVNYLKRVVNPYVKVAASLPKGCISGVMKNGDISIWTGFPMEFDEAEATMPVTHLWIPCPMTSPMTSLEDGDNWAITVKTFCLDPYASSPTLLVAYQDDPYFYRLRLDLSSNTVETAAFGDASFAPISCTKPFFSPVPDEPSIVITGDHMGCVSVYRWDETCEFPNIAIAPFKNFEAHEDGSAITTFTWNGLVLITGSAHGSTHVYDGLTFEFLRSFSSPKPRAYRQRWMGGHIEADQAVNHILVSPDKEFLLVCVGDSVMCWKAGPVPSPKSRGKAKMGTAVHRTRVGGGNSKYIEKLEMKESITELKHLHEEEAKRTQRAYGRLKAQRIGLERLGLSEAEMLDYVLMLSRDEIPEHLRHGETGDFENEFNTNLQASHRAVNSAGTTSSLGPHSLKIGGQLDTGNLSTSSTVAVPTSRPSSQLIKKVTSRPTHPNHNYQPQRRIGAPALQRLVPHPHGTSHWPTHPVALARHQVPQGQYWM
ncbi:hypothetical protein BD779DRAFT_1444511 [Infundibulicybe gibba]|nr:hypothetical protein BD779DRAFT_1444511 [Infundibulicybe gibba]